MRHIELIKLFGETINVAAEIDSIDAFSGHADHDGLVNWITGFEGPPKQVILVHGDTESLESLSFSLGSLGINNVIAVYQKTLRVGGAFVDESDATQEMSETRNNVIKRKKERIVPKKVLPVDSSYDKNLYERALEIASALQEKINIEDKDTERIDLYLSSLEDILEK